MNGVQQALEVGESERDRIEKFILDYVKHFVWFQREEELDMRWFQMIREDPTKFTSLARESRLIDFLMKEYNCHDEIFKIITNFTTIRRVYDWEGYLLEVDEVKVIFLI